MAHWSVGYRFRFTPEPATARRYALSLVTDAEGDPATIDERTEAT